MNVAAIRERLRDDAIIIYEGKGCFAGKVFQVGNIGEMSNFDIQFFLRTLKKVLLTLHTEAADHVVPLLLPKSKPTLNLFTPNVVKLVNS